MQNESFLNFHFALRSPCTIFVHMKRILLLGLFLSIFVVGGNAQQAEKYFSVMPQRVLPILDKTARLDLIDLYNSKLTAKAENVYGGQSEMLHKTDDFISIKCTEASSWQMKVLPQGHDTLIVCIHSVKAINTSSKIMVYKRDWHSVKREVPLPTFSQFVRANIDMSQERYKQLIAEMQHLPIEALWSETDPILTFRLSMNSLPQHDANDAELLVHPIVYRWAMGKWMLQP